MDLSDVPCRFVTDPHGVRVAYCMVGRGEQVLVLANGLGGRLSAWGPLVETLADRYRLISWDYRGLFGSGSPANRRYLGVSHQAEDVRRILEAERIERAVVCGWSMGVQVSLDFAAHYPERVHGLVLVNGTYGHAFSSALQPFVPLPYANVVLHGLAEALIERQWCARVIEQLAPKVAPSMVTVFEWLTGAPRTRILPIFERYLADLCEPKQFVAFLQLAQELDAQSAYSYLRDIAAPTLIVSGGWDPVTPAHRSRVMARRIPNARHVHVRRATHFALLEKPHIVVPAIERFLGELPPLRREPRAVPRLAAS